MGVQGWTWTIFVENIEFDAISVPVLRLQRRTEGRVLRQVRAEALMAQYADVLEGEQEVVAAAQI